MRGALILSLCLSVLSCTFDIDGLRGRGQVQAEGSVTTSDGEADRAAGLYDGSADAGPPDAILEANADLSPAEDTLDPDTLAPSCDDLFAGTVPGYLLCEETATICSFYYRSTTGARTCTSLCAPLTCLQARDNAQANSCELESPNACGSSPCTCGSQMNDTICSCQKS